MPVFTWMALVTQFLLLFAIPVITVALFLLMFDRHFGANFFNVEAGRRPAALAAPVLDIRSPRGVHPDLAGLRHRLRDHPGLLPQADLRLPVHGVLGHRHRLHGLGRVGAPHVRLRHRSGVGGRLLGVDDVHRRADGREDPQLARHDVRRQARFTTPMLFAIGLVAMFTIGGLSGVTHAVSPSDTPADRHLLHRRPLPLRALRRRAPRLLRRHVLLVAEGRSATCCPRSSARWHFWLILIGFNLTFGPMHIARPPGPAPPHVHLPERLRLRLLEHGRDDRRVHHRRRRAGVPRQRPHEPRASRSSAARSAMPTRGTPAASSGWSRRRRPRTTSTRSPIVTHLDEFWHRKYGEDEHGRPVRVAEPRGRRADGRRHRRAPAVAVVLADRAGARAAAHRLRHDLQPRLSAVGRRRSCCSPASTAGASSRPSTTTAGHDDHGHDDGHEPGRDDHDAPEAALTRRRPTPTRRGGGRR